MVMIAMNVSTIYLLQLEDYQSVFLYCDGNRVWSLGQYKLVSAHCDLYGVLIGKINTTLIYIPFDTLLFLNH